MAAAITKLISVTQFRFYSDRKNISFSDCISISSGFRHSLSSYSSCLVLVTKSSTNTRVFKMCSRLSIHIVAFASSEFSEDKFVAKVKMEIVVKKDQVESVINTIIDGTRTGEIGDGKIFGERGEKAEKMTGEMLSPS